MVRTTPRTSSRGFTIVELLIVIVVIAILAAITIVSYNGITKSATESSMKSDLRNAAKTLEIDNADGTGYPTSASSAGGGKGLKSSGDNQLTYNQIPNGYCISISNSRVDQPLYLNSGGSIEEGTCGVIVSTFAGSGLSGYQDGSGSAARFAYPQGVAVDTAGSIYIADAANHRIRKITASGVVAPFAGSSVAGSTNGTGAAAQFSYPTGIAIDSANNIFVSDSEGLIRKITPVGVVTTLAGAAASGFVDADGTAARFNSPQGLAVDNQGNVYVADTGNNRIRKITPAGTVSTLAGSGTGGFANGTGTAAQFDSPSDVSVDVAGVVYVSDWLNNRIRKITPAGVVTTLAGSGVGGFADGSGVAAQFFYPISLAIGADGSLYSGDEGGRIRKISSAGVVTTIAGGSGGSFADGYGNDARFDYPYGLAVDTTGTVYVADSENQRIRRITQ